MVTSTKTVTEIDGWIVIDEAIHMTDEEYQELAKYILDKAIHEKWWVPEKDKLLD